MCLIDLITVLLLAAEDGGDKVTSTVAFEVQRIIRRKVQRIAHALSACAGLTCLCMTDDIIVAS